MKKLIATMGVLALLVSNSFAQQGGKGDGGHGKYHELMQDIPNLTEDQKASLKEIKAQSKKDSQPQREELRAVKDKLHALKVADEPNLKEINSLIDRMHSLQAKLDKDKVASMVKMRSVLTPEQRKAFDAKREEKQAKRKEIHEKKKDMKEAK